MSSIKVTSNISAFINNLSSAVNDELEKIGNEILNESKAEAPIDTGELRLSGYVIMRRNHLNPSVEVGFKAKYAIYVHENYNSRHNIGNAGFLIGPFRRWEGKVVTRLRDRINRGR